MKIKYALLKKRFGIPAALLLSVLIFVGVAASALLMLSITAKIQYPTHEELSLNLGTTSAGYSASDTVTGFFALPTGSYDVTWTLSGATGKYTGITIDIDYDSNVELATDVQLTKSSPTATLTIPGAGVSWTAKYDVLVTAAVDVKAGVSIAVEDANLTVDISAVKTP